MPTSCTITRYYGTSEKDLEQLDRFIQQAKTYSHRILIGVHIDKDLTDCLNKYSSKLSSNIPVDFIGIKPWIGVSTPLNILLNHLSSTETTVIIQSVEIQCTSDQIHRLQTYLTDTNVLCVGAALDGHQMTDHPLNSLQGDTSPWNTLIIWNAEKLRRTGFPLCADFVEPPGMEDSAVIGLQQKCFGGMASNRALLVRLNSSIHWHNQFPDDHERSVKHQIKMRSKNLRTQQLFQILDITSHDQIGIEYIDENSCK